MNIMINCGRVEPYFTKRYKLLKQMQRGGHTLFLVGYESGFEERIAGEGMRFLRTPFSRAGMNPLADLKLLKTYYRAIRENQISLVHSYTAKPNIYGSIAARLAGVRQIYPVVNGLGYAYTGSGLKANCVRAVTDLLYRVAFGCATRVFFQNRDDAEEMIGRGTVRREKCVVISGSGIDLEAYPRKPLQNHHVFLMATRLLVTKGTRTYLEAARLVKKSHPEAVFQLAGGLDPNPDGVTREELESYVASGAVEYLGVVSDMPAALESCSVFVLPSYYREGVPHAVLEAMATGRAVLTTDAIGCRETVNGKNGFLVPPKDAAALAEKMVWCLEHPEQVEAMGEESYRYARERFDVDIVNRVMLEEMGLAPVEAQHG
ncbi:MAG: glycosyltransferase family 4 protein [Clostridiales bacterium]|nr:glycosyltransferase family 4 protein [Clostridiales bacterium]